MIGCDVRRCHHGPRTTPAHARTRVEDVQWTDEQKAMMTRAERLRWYGRRVEAENMVAEHVELPSIVTRANVHLALNLDVLRWYAAQTGKHWDGRAETFVEARNLATRRRHTCCTASATFRIGTCNCATRCTDARQQDSSARSLSGTRQECGCLTLGNSRIGNCATRCTDARQQDSSARSLSGTRQECRCEHGLG